MPTFNHSDLGERPHQSKSSRQTLADPVLGLSAPKFQGGRKGAAMCTSWA